MRGVYPAYPRSPVIRISLSLIEDLIDGAGARPAGDQSVIGKSLPPNLALTISWPMTENTPKLYKTRRFA